MQFHLEPDELKLLANVLLEQDPRPYQELLNKVLAHDLRLDGSEFEQAADLLAGKKRSLHDEIARQSDVTLKTELHCGISRYDSETNPFVLPAELSTPECGRNCCGPQAHGL